MGAFACLFSFGRSVFLRKRWLMLTEANKSIKVLAIDGGGIRGIIPAVLLGGLQARLTQELWRYFDLIAGTSTGGIIALGIGTRCNNGQPYSPSELVDLYVKNGPAIFRKIPLWTWLRQFLRPKYSPSALEESLKTFFRETRFSSAVAPVLISSYDLQSQRPFFFKSHRIASDPSYDWPVASIARATSAAPTFFPPLHLAAGNESYTLVDGGVFVNNPSVAAYAEARWLYPEATNFVVISVGTGDRQDRITYTKAKKWGLVGWARQIVPVLMDSVSEAVDYELKSFPGCDYFRLQPENLPQPCAAMDNVTEENLEALQTLGEKFAEANAATLDQIAVLLQEGRGSTLPGIGLTTTRPRPHPHPVLV
jgi:uncharacterized protein